MHNLTRQFLGVSFTNRCKEMNPLTCASLKNIEPASIYEKSFISVACACVGQTYAQQTLGLAGSNYSGTHGIFLNPAAIANSRLGFYLAWKCVGLR